MANFSVISCYVETEIKEERDMKLDHVIAQPRNNPRCQHALLGKVNQHTVTRLESVAGGWPGRESVTLNW